MTIEWWEGLVFGLAMAVSLLLLWLGNREGKKLERLKGETRKE